MTVCKIQQEIKDLHHCIGITISVDRKLKEIDLLLYTFGITVAPT